jgi:hypothetical protein
MIFDYESMLPVLELLENCQGIEQEREHHPEGDVFNHLLQCFKWALRETYDIDLVLASLLHDVGKAIELKGHEHYSVDMLSPYLSIKSLWLIENHMRIRHYIDGTMHKLSKVREMAGHPWFCELIQLARFDKLGRKPNARISYDRYEIIDRLNKHVQDGFIYNQGK